MADKLSAGLAEINTEISDSSLQNGSQMELTEKEVQEVVRKLDLRLVTLVGFMYCVSLIDRTNLSNANIAGMKEDLDLHGFRYNIISLAFFPTYVVFQIPSTVIVRKIGPRLHLGTITLIWGCLMIGMGFVKDWSTMAGMRVLLGILEAGFFPSCVYLLSTWFSRYDMGRRYSIFYILGSVAAAFSGILSYGVMQLKGRGNLNGWRWIFIIEGILTCVIAGIGYIFLVGFPDDTKPSKNFLTEKQINWVINRVNKDRGDVHTEPFNLGKYLRSGLDLKIWGFAMIFFNTTTISYGLAYFLPVILKDQLHFSTGLSQILIAPPYVFAGIITFGTAWVGDKRKIRGPIIIFNNLLSLIGILILGWTKTPGTKYFGIFLMTAGANSNVPATMTYQANNIRGQWKRAFCSATMVGFGGIGGIAGSLVFRGRDAPTYRPGLYACLTCTVLSIIIVGFLTAKFKADNRKADAGEIAIEGSEEGFRYTC